MKWRQVILALLGLYCGVVLLTLWLSPRAAGWQPQDPYLSANQPYQITFNVPVDPGSVEDHFSISPPVEGTLSVEGKQIRFEPAAPLEYGISYTITLAAGLRGQNRLPSLRKSTWSFQVKPPRLIYLRLVDGKENLWVKNDSGLSEQITDEPYGIWDYSVAPNSRGILLSSVDGDGSIDLVLVGLDGQRRVLLDCQDNLCQGGRWQPNGDLVAFERRPLDETGTVPEVWLLDTSSGVQQSVHNPALLAEAGFDTLSSSFPRWSADGQLLSYFKPDARLLVVLDMDGSNPRMIPANLDVMGEWSPVSRQLAYTELTFGNEKAHEHEDLDGNLIQHEGTSLFSHTVVADLELEQVTDIAKGLEINDGRPAWSSDGKALALGRTVTGAGRQIWLLRENDEEPEAVTDDPFVHHTALTWSPDDRQIAFMRVGLTDANNNVVVWTMDIDGGLMTIVEEDAFLPGWLP